MFWHVLKVYIIHSFILSVTVFICKVAAWFGHSKQKPTNVFSRDWNHDSTFGGCLLKKRRFFRLVLCWHWHPRTASTSWTIHITHLTSPSNPNPSPPKGVIPDFDGWQVAATCRSMKAHAFFHMRTWTCILLGQWLPSHYTHWCKTDQTRIPRKYFKIPETMVDMGHFFLHILGTHRTGGCWRGWLATRCSSQGRGAQLSLPRWDLRGARE